MSADQTKPLDAIPLTALGPSAKPPPSSPPPNNPSTPPRQATPSPPSAIKPVTHTTPPAQAMPTAKFTKERELQAITQAYQALITKQHSILVEKQYLELENARFRTHQMQQDTTLRAYEGELEQLKRAHADEAAQRVAAEARLKTALDEHAKKDAEVAALRDFLCLHNFSSESDVCDRVNHLNNVIEGTAQQFADFCVEACRASQGSPSNKSDTPSLGATANLLELKSASQLQERLEEILGRRLFSKLKKSSSPDDNIQLPLQWAFQTLIVQMVAYDCLDPFCFVSWVEDGPPDDTLVQLCGDIQRQEPQSSFGRWRSMTFKHLRQSTPETDQQRLIDEAVDKAVLWCYAVTSVTFRERNLDLRSFTESCKTSMVEIFEEARKLVIMVREEIVTAQYESNVPVSGDAFDKDLMVLEGGDTPEEGDEVVCTVRLGMTRSYKGSREATATVVKEGFVKAEVITRRILKDLA